MAAEDLIPALQTAVSSFGTTVDGKQAVIDGKVASGATADGNAQTARNAAETALDTAKQSSKVALRDTLSAKANVDHQDLAALAASKAETAVDVFVYDTSKDSDGGAWRKRCSKLSWYNETLNTSTRGSRREFPAVAVIVAEANKVTIYDGDDPSLPMWMVFQAATTYSTKLITYGDSGSISAVTGLNGVLVVSTTSGASNQGANGVFLINFIADGAIKYCNSQLSTEYDSVLSDRNSAGHNNYLNGTDLPRLTSNMHNDVAMTVLDDAPTDADTGLPVPTIAVAEGIYGQSGGGVCVIKDDGTVIDILANQSAAGGYQVKYVAFDSEHRLILANSYNNQHTTLNIFDDIPTSDLAGNNAHPTARTYASSNTPNIFPTTVGSQAKAQMLTAANDHIAFNTNTGLSRLAEDTTDKPKGMVAYTTSDYNTGWMNGDIKGAFLSDTDGTDLVGSGLGNDDFTSYADQAAAEAAGYVFNSCALDAANDKVDFSGVGANLAIPTGLSGGTPAIVEIAISNYVSGSAPLQNDYVAQTAFSGASALNSNGTHKFYIPAIGFLRISTINLNASVDSISVKLADEDRSVNSVGLAVNGTVTRTPVATGADLVAYSGFSSSNYLEQPYNSDLDFGTGDFCVMGWVNTTASGSGYFMERENSFFVRLLSGSLRFGVGTGVLDGGNLTSTGWRFVCGGRASGQSFLYLDGGLEASNLNAENINGATPSLFHGINTGLTTWAGSTSYALWRISATAPTADQITKIYNDEKLLFQENAQATLYGSSDAVTALAHDPDTGLLHVGTSAGRSVFKGLRRVDNTTTAVGTAISAVNGMVVEE